MARSGETESKYESPCRGIQILKSTHWIDFFHEANRDLNGGARRNRTADLVIANDALSQLSYGPDVTRTALI